MRGLLVFNDNHELLYLKVDRSLRALLKKRQSELQYSSANSVDEAATAATVSANTARAFDGCDPITTAYMFLPLIVCYESMQCMKFDRYVSIWNRNVCFYFAESNDDNRLILLAVGDGDTKKEEMTFLLGHFVSALEFAFGPLSCSMSHPSLSSQLDLLTYTLKNISTPNFGDTDEFLSLESTSDEKTFLQTVLQHVDVSGLTKENQSDSGQKSPIVAALTCIGGQFHAFLKCQLCFLVRKRVILATFSRHSQSVAAKNTADRKDKRRGEGGGEEQQYQQQRVLAKAWQVIALLRTITRFGYNNYSGKRQPEPTCYYCYTVSLQHHTPSSNKFCADCLTADVFADVFRIDLSEDIQLICVTPVTHGDLMSDLTQTMSITERLDRLRFEHALLLSDHTTASKARKIQSYYDYWLNRLDAQARSLCDRLDDRLIFMEGAKSRKLAATFQSLYRNLREISSSKNRRPADTEGEETSTLKALRRLAGALLLDTFSAAVDEAKRYKLEKLDRCWRNLNSSDLYASTVASLMDSIPSFSLLDEGPPAVRFKLDAIAYIFLLPEKRVLLTNGFQIPRSFEISEQILIRKSVHEMLDGIKSNKEDVSKMISPREKEGSGHLLVFMSARKEEKRAQSSTNLFSKLSLAITSSASEKGMRADDGESALRNSVKEPMVIMGAYESFVNEDLAWRETRLLAIHLYELVLGLRWSYY